MLEVKNLIKIYHTKGGAEVRALDDISLAFPDKGMVFLLGRSGSGKSTLLNVCGGLDAPDSGEIIVKGKSSKDFSAGDFDSYRNTYVGFIFQEYNILNEFSVEDNIALALELQGKPKDKQEIAKLLEQVDLTDFAKRKPNTLSGGQKQRVAIARALVKNPEIIMADEPTGALDSNTGKQVLDTLKKLSEDKLVIVVSHDREFAEEYGDRIIELKDGKVINDAVKEYLPPDVKDENVSIVSDNTIFIKKGSKLTTQDFTKIKKFVSECDDDILISKDQTGIKYYKKANKISDDNSKECFKQLTSQPQQKTYSDDENKFIRSRLPLKHAIKIGVSSVKVKPVRFTFTIILSVIAFILFGLFSCLMLYDAQEVNIQSIKDADVEYLNMSKFYKVTDLRYDSPDDTPTPLDRPYVANMSDEDLNNVKSKFGNGIIPVYKLSQCDIDNLSIDTYKQSLYNGRIYGFIPADAPVNYVLGKAPSCNDQIAISQFLFDTIKSGQLKDNNAKEITVNTFEDIEIRINGKTFSVSGVFESEKVPEGYKKLATQTDTSGRWSNYMQSGFYGYVAIDPAAFDSFKTTTGIENSEILMDSYGGFFTHFSLTDQASGAYNNVFRPLKQGVSYYDNNGNLSTATGNETSTALVRYSVYFSALRQVADALSNPENERYNKDFDESYADIEDSTELEALCAGDIYEISTLETYAKKVLDVTNKYFNLKDTDLNLLSFSGDVIMRDVNIAGFYMTMENTAMSMYAYVSDDVIQIYKSFCIARGMFSQSTTSFSPQNYSDAMFSRAFVSTDGSASKIKDILTYNNSYDSQGVKYEATTGMLDELSYYNMLVELLSKVFLWVGIVLAIFSMLLLFNFITASISAKKKEIGILRAVGARGTDVFKIFFCEAFIIAAICIILSIIFTGVFAGLINNSLSKDSGITVSIFNFGILSVIMIIAIAIVSAFISTFFPVYSNAKKKPVESIRSL